MNGKATQRSQLLSGNKTVVDQAGQGRHTTGATAKIKSTRKDNIVIQIHKQIICLHQFPFTNSSQKTLTTRTLRYVEGKELIEEVQQLSKVVPNVKIKYIAEQNDAFSVCKLIVMEKTKKCTRNDNR